MLPGCGGQCVARGRWLCEAPPTGDMDTTRQRGHPRHCVSVPPPLPHATPRPGLTQAPPTPHARSRLRNTHYTRGWMTDRPTPPESLAASQGQEARSPPRCMALAPTSATTTSAPRLTHTTLTHTHMHTQPTHNPQARPASRRPHPPPLPQGQESAFARPAHLHSTPPPLPLLYQWRKYKSTRTCAVPPSTFP